MLYHFLDWLFPQYRSHVEESLSIVDAVREKLKGIQVDTKYLDDLPKQDRDELLAKAHDLYTNHALARISTHLKNRQLVFTVTEAKTHEQGNFGRATILGICLLEEEIERLAGIWDEEHKPQEDFNHNDVI
jgi:hypothetical protein